MSSQRAPNMPTIPAMENPFLESSLAFSPPPRTPRTPIYTAQPYPPEAYAHDTYPNPMLYRSPSVHPGHSDPRNSMVLHRPTGYYSNEDFGRDNMLVEIGKLKAEVKNQESQIRDLELKHEVAVMKNEDLNVHVPQLELTIKTLRASNEELNKTLKEKDKAMQELEEKLAKANMTIRVQSDQIMNPKDGRAYGPTPIRYEASQWESSRIESQRPKKLLAITQGGEDVANQQQYSTELVPYNTQNTTYGAAYGEYKPYYEAQAMNYNALAMRGSRSNPSGSWSGKSHNAALSAAAPAFTPSSSSGYESMMVQSMWSQSVPFNGMMAHNYGYAPGEHFALLSAQFNRLYNAVESWGKHYSNVPNKERDKNLSPDVFGLSIPQKERELWVALMTDPKTRWMVVARYGILNVTEFACHPVLVRDFKDGFDRRLLAEKIKTYHGCADYLRREAAQNVATIVSEMMRDPDWDTHIGRVVDRQVRSLWSVLSTTVNADSDHSEAWRALTHITEEAVRLGLIMLQRVSTFSVDFPPTGPNSPYNPANMISRDYNFPSDPTTIGRLGMKVRFAFAPVVTETPMGPKMKMRPECVISARVLLEY